MNLNISDWIALGSLLVAVISIIWTATNDRKVRKQEQQLRNYQLLKNEEAETARKKALIEAKLVESGATRSIKISNNGQATAKNIRLSPTPKEFEQARIILMAESNYDSYPFLHPGEDFKITIFLAEGHKPFVRTVLSWDDDFALNNEREQILNF